MTSEEIALQKTGKDYNSGGVSQFSEHEILGFTSASAHRM